jgi:hypothetical protein
MYLKTASKKEREIVQIRMEQIVLDQNFRGASQ